MVVMVPVRLLLNKIQLPISQHLLRMSTSTKFLINDPKYKFLKDLDLQEHNLGVYNGKWCGSGQVLERLILFLSILKTRKN
jgi:hypothetical protein